MTKFLIVLPLGERHVPLFERILLTATGFLGTRGNVERDDLGRYSRAVRKGKATESLELVELSLPDGQSRDESLAQAAALEGVLRATIAAAGLGAADVRVFVAADEGA